MTDRKRRNNELRKILNDKMVAQGWDNVRQFAMGSKVPYSMETVRRLLSGALEDEKPIEPTTMAVISRYLGFTPEEIQSMLKNYTDDKELYRLIGRQDVKLSVYDQALITAVDMITKDRPELLKMIADQVDLVAGAAGIDVREHTEKLRRKRK